MQLIATEASAEDTVSTNSPSIPVGTPLDVPSSMTVAPITGPSSSTTTPLIWYPFWANTSPAAISSKARVETILFIRLVV